MGVARLKSGSGWDETKIQLFGGGRTQNGLGGFKYCHAYTKSLKVNPISTKKET